ncbi:MAG: hypothetical protein LBS74_04330 [Oscillospiraceae bacterium]|nr:hypothetical protein [Oscillospiraceae bacterium]
MIAYINKNKSNLITALKIALIAAFAAMGLYSVINHEPWRDEAQAWLIARDCTLPQLFEQISYEGHPALWHLILYPFAQGGASFWCIYAINGVFYIALLYLLFFKSPFSLWQSLAVAVASPVVCYSFEARSYMLMFLLLMLCAFLYPKRRERPILFAVSVLLLSNIHAHAIGAAGAMLLLSLLDLRRDFSTLTPSLKKRRIASLSIMAAGLALFALQILPSLSKNRSVDAAATSGGGELRQIFDNISANLFVTYGSAAIEAGKVAICLVLIALALACMFSLRRAVIFLGATAFPVLFYVFVYYGHSEDLLILLIFACWMLKNEPVDKQGIPQRIPRGAQLGAVCLLCGVLIFGIPHAKAYFELNSSKVLCTSGSLQAAEFLNLPENQGKVLVAERPEQSSSIVPLLKGDRKLWYPYLGDYGSYITWSEALVSTRKQTDTAKLTELIQANFNESDSILVILTHALLPIDEANKAHYTELFATRNVRSDEDYVVFQFEW